MDDCQDFGYKLALHVTIVTRYNRYKETRWQGLQGYRRYALQRYRRYM